MPVNTAGGVLIRSLVRQRCMPTSGVAVLDDHRGFEEAVEFVHEAFVAYAIVEGLDVAVFPRLTRWNVADPDLIVAERPQCAGYELGPVVAAQYLRCPPQSANAFSRAVTRSSAGMDLSTMMSTGCRVFVDHRRDLDLPTISGGVELEVDRPQHLRGIGLGNRGGRSAGSFTDFADFHPQSFLAPETLNLLLVDHPAGGTQVRPRPPEPFALVGFGPVSQPLPQIGVRIVRGVSR
jgi:hypothetical protein